MILGIPPASETTSGRLATANKARMADAVMPCARSAYRSSVVIETRVLAPQPLRDRFVRIRWEVTLTELGCHSFEKRALLARSSGQRRASWLSYGGARSLPV